MPSTFISFKDKSPSEALDIKLAILEEVRKRTAEKLKNEQISQKSIENKPKERRKRKRLFKKYLLHDCEMKDKNVTEKRAFVQKDKLVKAIRLLEDHEECIKKKAKSCNSVVNSCKKHLKIKMENESWDTAAYIIKNIRHALISHDWDNLTHLLLLLMDQHSSYLPFLKEMTFLNLLMNKSDMNSEILDDFLQLCFSKVISLSVPDEFDVWYEESPFIY